MTLLMHILKDHLYGDVVLLFEILYAYVQIMSQIYDIYRYIKNG